MSDRHIFCKRGSLSFSKANHSKALRMFTGQIIKNNFLCSSLVPFTSSFWFYFSICSVTMPASLPHKYGNTTQEFEGKSPKLLLNITND